MTIEESKFEFSFKISIAEIKDAQQAELRSVRFPIWEKTAARIICILPGAGIGFVAMLIAFELYLKNFISRGDVALWFGIIAAFFLALYLWTSKRLAARHYARIFSNEHTNTIQTWAIDDRGIRMITQGSNWDFNWSYISSVARGKTTISIRITGMVFALPMRVIGEPAEVDRVFDYMNQQLATHS